MTWWLLAAPLVLLGIVVAGWRWVAVGGKNVPTMAEEKQTSPMFGGLKPRYRRTQEGRPPLQHRGVLRYPRKSA